MLTIREAVKIIRDLEAEIFKLKTKIDKYKRGSQKRKKYKKETFICIEHNCYYR